MKGCNNLAEKIAVKIKKMEPDGCSARLINRTGQKQARSGGNVGMEE